MTLIKGARATEITRADDGATVELQDGRKISGSHVLLAIGAHPNTDAIGLESSIRVPGGPGDEAVADLKRRLSDRGYEAP